MKLFSVLASVVRRALGRPQPQPARRRSDRRPAIAPSGNFRLAGRHRVRQAWGDAKPFESGVLREIRKVVDSSTIRTRRNHDEGVRGTSVLTLLGPEMNYPRAAESKSSTRADVDAGLLSQEVLQFFDGLGILPIIGVNDPALREKLTSPAEYGWSAEVQRIAMFSGAANPNLPGLRRWRLTPPMPMGSVGQSLILTDNGDVFLETVGPWGTVWMHKSPDGTISERRLPARAVGSLLELAAV
jgi:hypothetical protein